MRLVLALPLPVYITVVSHFPLFILHICICKTGSNNSCPTILPVKSEVVYVKGFLKP